MRLRLRYHCHDSGRHWTQAIECSDEQGDENQKLLETTHPMGGWEEGWLNDPHGHFGCHSHYHYRYYQYC